ncbi:sulfate/molybdate ABC transporter ATP-binding protein [Aeromicrobium sp. UC242_57]|uniref:sulfate/molybdate ABC transporter ATP-binding protein n=1 Tax=Aeromicrobium sp. UC242_57 TaxID=3374624 RepID=UPI00378C3B7E
MTLHVDISVTKRDVQATLDVAPGETVAIVGPNGSGKSTLLASVAGIVRPDGGSVTLDGTVLFEHATGTWRPPHDRGTALLAQDPLLFPHLDALDNVAFGPRSAGLSRGQARTTASHWLAEVDVSDLAHRKPSQLSGGQAQRVAIARALAADPRLLLLDEPMAALDITVVPAMRQLLKRVLADRSAIIVTHDVLDALLLADRVVVMEHGRIVEHGPTQDVLSRPRSTFAAGIAGLNLARGLSDAGGVVTASGLRIAGLEHGPDIRPSAAAVAVFSPSAVSVHRERPHGSPRNVIRAVVRGSSPTALKSGYGPTRSALTSPRRLSPSST